MQREAFGKLLIILRKKNGLSQKELAERLSVSTSAVSKWENGKNLPDMMMLSRIADILQVSCDELHNPEKTLEKLDNPEFQKRNVEEGDKENTDNTGENKESEPEPQKKNYGRIVRMSFLIGILAIATGMFLIYMAGHRKPAFQQIGTRYIDDLLWGRVYEIAYVVDGEMTNDSINVHLDEVRATLNQEVIDTNIVKTTYYDNKEDATAWKETDVLSISFPVNAQKTAQRVGEGYTSEGIYYEVYVAEDLAENDIVLCGASVSVTREVIYSGVVKPQTEISWREKINGSYYSGVLTISKYSYTTSQTVATYTGVLYKE